MPLEFVLAEPSASVPTLKLIDRPGTACPNSSTSEALKFADVA